MTDSPQRDGDAPGDPLSAHLAEAYSRLRDDAHRVDLGAARRDLDKRIGAAGDGARSSTWRWVPVTFAALLLVVAVVSAVAIVNRVPSGEVEAADGGDTAGTRPAGHGGQVGPGGDGVAGTSWRVVGHPADVRTPILVELTADGELRYFGDCQVASARYVIDDGRLVVAPDPKPVAEIVGGVADDPAALKACEPSGERRLAVMHDLVAGNEAFAIDGDLLELVSAAGDVLRLERLDAPDLSALNGSWSVVSVAAGGEELVPGTEMTVAFDGEEPVQLTAGACVAPLGSATVDGDFLSVDLIGVADACPAEAAAIDGLALNLARAAVGLDGDRLVLDGIAGRVILTSDVTTGDGDTGDTGDSAGFVADESLVWSVIGVAADDTLNVRAEPGASGAKVGELPPDAVGVEASATTTPVGSGQWRQVRWGDVEGWVNEQFLIAGPATLDEVGLQAMESVTGSFLAWGQDASAAPGPGSWQSPSGVYLGGIGVYGDYPFPLRFVDADSLGDRGGWEQPRDFTPSDWELGSPCGECQISSLDFVSLPPADRDLGLDVDPPLDGASFEVGPVGSLDAVPHVTIDVPATSETVIDWKRIHVFLDWRTGEPLVHTVYVWGWTP